MPHRSLDADDLIRIAFDLSPSGMMAVDERGVIVAANREAERLFGWARDELLGRAVETLVPERFRRGHPGHRAAFMRSPSARPMGAGRDLHALRRDGVEFPVEIGLNPVVTQRGTFVLMSVVDITERRRVEEEQRRSQRLETLGVMAGGIAHDFNNILLGIIGHTELALRTLGRTDASRDDLELVLTAADRGRQLVQRILSFSRESKVSRRPVRIGDVVAEAVSLLRASLPSTVEIRESLDPDAPVVLADETQIHQVLMNLATNAAQAMPDGGTLTIELTAHEHERASEAPPSRKPGRVVRLRVRDTGVGMPPEVLEHALEPFFTTKAAGEGTGLGLSVVHGIITSHGGTMNITSQHGRGTTITLDLPAGGEITEAPGDSSAGGARQNALRILFVEDEPQLASMQRRQLEHLGYHVTVHTASLEALEDFRARPQAFDLVITDDTMPRMTGTALTAEILRIRPDIPVLMVSGGDRLAQGKAQLPGICRVLLKPHTLEELDHAIREVMRGSNPGG